MADGRLNVTHGSCDVRHTSVSKVMLRRSGAISGHDEPHPMGCCPTHPHPDPGTLGGHPSPSHPVPNERLAVRVDPTLPLERQRLHRSLLVNDVEHRHQHRDRDRKVRLEPEQQGCTCLLRAQRHRYLDVRPPGKQVFDQCSGEPFRSTTHHLHLLNSLTAVGQAGWVEHDAGDDAENPGRHRDAATVTRLFRELAPQVRRWAAYHHGHEVADEILAETFLVVWRRIDSLSPNSAERRAWVFGIARNIGRQVLRARAKTRAVEVKAQRWPPLFGADIAEHHAERARVWELLDVLPAAERAAFTLFVAADLSPTQIAVLEGTTPATIRTRLSRARARLRPLITTDHSPPTTTTRSKGGNHDSQRL